MTMRVTMLQSRMGEAGAVLAAGSTYTVSDAYGRWLIGAGFSSDADGVLTEASQNQVRIQVTAARLAELVAASALIPNAIYAVGSEWFRALTVSAYASVGASSSSSSTASSKILALFGYSHFERGRGGRYPLFPDRGCYIKASYTNPGGGSGTLLYGSTPLVLFAYPCSRNSVVASNMVLTFDGTKMLSFTAVGDTVGPAQDVTGGGHFFLVSGDGLRGCWVVIRWRNKPGGAVFDNFQLTSGSVAVEGGLNFQGLHTWWIAKSNTMANMDCVLYSTSGDSSVDMANRVDRMLLDSPAHVLLDFGYNNVDDPAQVIADLATIVTKIKAKGCGLTIFAPLQSIGNASNQKAFLGRARIIAELMRNYAPRGDLTVVNPNEAIADNTRAVNNSLYQPAALYNNYTTDTVHPCGIGTYRMSTPRLEAALSAPLPQKHAALINRGQQAALDITNTWFSPYSNGNGNIFRTTGALAGTGGVHSGTGSGSGSIPATWSLNRTLLDIVSTAPADNAAITRDDGIGGNWWRVAISSATTDTSSVYSQLIMSDSPTMTFLIGKSVQLFYEFRLRNCYGFKDWNAILRCGSATQAYALRADSGQNFGTPSVVASVTVGATTTLNYSLAHRHVVGESIMPSSFTGADAAFLNDQTWVVATVPSATQLTITANTTGKTIVASSGTTVTACSAAPTVGGTTVFTNPNHQLMVGDYVTHLGFTGADAAAVNGITCKVLAVGYASGVPNTYTVDINTTGKTITQGAGRGYWTLADSGTLTVASAPMLVPTGATNVIFEHFQYFWKYGAAILDIGQVDARVVAQL